MYLLAVVERQQLMLRTAPPKITRAALFVSVGTNRQKLGHECDTALGCTTFPRHNLLRRTAGFRARRFVPQPPYQRVPHCLHVVHCCGATSA
jgi:hypothetical protein